MQVLCCCNPANEVGSIPVLKGLKAGLELRRWKDEEGNTGLAFASNHQPVEVLSKIPGFQSNIVLAEGTKTWEAESGNKKKRKKKDKKKKRRASILDMPKMEPKVKPVREPKN